ncbi:MAG: hypothetical protein R8L58_01030 [Mariprofundaceae bacterium]
MPTESEQSWRPGKRDAMFLAIVAVVILLLVLGSGDRTTRPVPDNDTHQHATSRAACMSCHDSSGVHPQPRGHTKADQCFQCHAQPKGWNR